MQIRLLFPTDRWICVRICSIWQVVLCCRRTKLEQRWKSSNEWISEDIKALYTSTHTLLRTLLLLKQNLARSYSSGPNKKLWWANKMSNRKETRRLQWVTHLPSMPRALLWCRHSNRLKSEEKHWDEDQPVNWWHREIQERVILCFMPSQVLETSTSTSHAHAAHILNRVWKEQQKKIWMTAWYLQQKTINTKHLNIRKT